MGNAGGGGGKTGLYIVGYTRKGKDISYYLKDKSNTLKTPAGNTQQYLAEGKRIRRLTLRETFRLQGVDDSYKIIVSDSRAYQISGNGVTVPLIKALAEQVKHSYLPV
jgi:DNA (cytosine-5)-methyltransferase 1